MLGSVRPSDGRCEGHGIVSGHGENESAGSLELGHYLDGQGEDQEAADGYGALTIDGLSKDVSLETQPWIRVDPRQSYLLLRKCAPRLSWRPEGLSTAATDLSISFRRCTSNQSAPRGSLHDQGPTRAIAATIAFGTFLEGFCVSSAILLSSAAITSGSTRRGALTERMHHVHSLSCNTTIPVRRHMA